MPHVIGGREFLTESDVNRAIYIDFEGFMDRQPTFLGVLCEGTWKAVVTDPVLEGLATQSSHYGCGYHDFKGAVQSLASRATEEMRTIVAFTQHERLLIKQYGDVEIGSAYHDAHKSARWWSNRPERAARVPENTLDAFAQAIGYRWPVSADLSPTTCLRSVIHSVNHGRSFTNMLTSQRSNWRGVLKYNEHDCRSMQALCQRVTHDLGRWTGLEPRSIEQPRGMDVTGACDNQRTEEHQ